MTTIAVTAATGQLGRLVIDALIARGTAPASIIAGVRSPEKAADLAARGVQVREADYTRPETLGPALEGVDRLLMISLDTPGQRLSGHTNMIEAAKQAGVKLLAYTSVLNAATTTMTLAGEHQATEELLQASGLPVVLLRNGWYTENYTDQLATALEHGMVGSSGDGLVAPAARKDFAEASAVVLTTDGHEGQAYELAGDEALTLTQIAAIASAATGQQITYTDVPVEAYAEILAGVGLPAPINAIIADSSAAVGRGELATASNDLARLLGRPTTSVEETFRNAAAVAA